MTRAGLQALCLLFFILLAFLDSGLIQRVPWISKLPTLQPLRDSFLKFEIARSGRHTTDPDIVIAGIDDATMKAGAFNRAAHAQVIRNLTAAGARVIFYDVEFDEPRDPQLDHNLGEAVRESGRCVLAAAIKTTQSSFLPPTLIPDFDAAFASGRASMGLINIEAAAVHQDAMVTATLTDAQGANPVTYLTAATAILCRLNHLQPSDVQLANGRVGVAPLWIPTEEVTQSVSSGSGDVQELRVTRLLTVYSAPATGPEGKPGNDRYRVVSYLQLLDANDPVLRTLKGSVVMIGENTSSDTDLIVTPVGRMKGVEGHAQLLDTLLHGPYFEVARPLNRLYCLDVVAEALLCLCLAAALYHQRTAGRMLAVATLTVAVALGIELALGDHALIFNAPLLAANLAVTFLLAALSRFSATRRALVTFIPRDVADQLLATGRSEVKRCHATVIVTDIRGYTSLSETKTPRQILTMLNEYHTETVAIFERHGGSVLNYQGDAQIIIFGYPRKLRDPARAAVLAAIDTSEAIDRLRVRWNLTKDQTFDVGAGVCTGLVSVGQLGSDAMQAEFTVIGETVRRCHKVQSMSNKLHSNVLVDEETMQACRVRPKLKDLGEVELEGLKRPVRLFGQ